MKIVVVVPYLKSIGGATRYAWELSEFLASQGDSVIVVSLYTDRQLYTPKKIIKVIDLEDESSLTQTLKFWFRIGKISKKLSDLIKIEKPDIVFFNHFPCTMWVQKYGNIPVICYPQDINLLYTNTYINNLSQGKRFLWKILRIFVRIYDKRKWKYFDKVVCHSKFSANHISGFYNLKPEIIYLGTNTEVFAPYNSDSKTKAILTMADTQIRRADLLIKASAQLRKKRDDFKIWIVGNKGDLDNELRQLVKKHNLSEIVEFFGEVADSKLSELYSKSLVVVHLVKEAPFGLIVTEAMACGTPVISWKPGGPEETIVHGETGFLIHEGDTKGLIKYIEKFLDEPQLSTIMGKNGRIRVKKLFNLSKKHDEMRLYLQGWINKKLQ